MYYKNSFGIPLSRLCFIVFVSSKIHDICNCSQIQLLMLLSLDKPQGCYISFCMEKVQILNELKVYNIISSLIHEKCILFQIYHMSKKSCPRSPVQNYETFIKIYSSPKDTASGTCTLYIYYIFSICNGYCK